MAENAVGRSKPIATRWRVVAVVVIVAVEVRVLRARWIPSCGGELFGPPQDNPRPHQKRRQAQPRAAGPKIFQPHVVPPQRTPAAQLPRRLAAPDGGQ